MNIRRRVTIRGPPRFQRGIRSSSAPQIFPTEKTPLPQFGQAEPNSVPRGAVRFFQPPQKGGYFGKVLRPGVCGKARVHVGPLVIFSVGRRFEVLRGIPRPAKEAGPKRGMGELVGGRFLENSGDTPYPSPRAREAKTVYLLRAWGSPVKAAFKFASALLPESESGLSTTAPPPAGPKSEAGCLHTGHWKSVGGSYPRKNIRKPCT